VLGSNLFNTLGVLALPGLIEPGPVSELILRRDLPVMFGLVLLLFLMVRLWPPKFRLGRAHGAILLACFMAYLGAIYVAERYPSLMG
jgi:cation:H+ antiporter